MVQNMKAKQNRGATEKDVNLNKTSTSLQNSINFLSQSYCISTERTVDI